MVVNSLILEIDPKQSKEAILNAEPNETILIAGKGHENYQDYGNKILKISDKEIIKNINRKKLIKKNKVIFIIQEY